MADTAFALPLALPPPGTRERARSLHEQLKAAMLDGRLPPGARLPSTRALAASLGVSRNTVIAVYDRLLADGYISAAGADGTRVAALLPQRPAAARQRQTPAAAETRLAAFWRDAAFPAHGVGPAPALDFRLGQPDWRQLPFDIWTRLAARSARTLARGGAGYADAAGLPALRAAIAGHAAFTRAVACGPDDVIVTGGAQQAFDLLARVLVAPGRSVVALEDPGYPPLRAAFQAQGAVLAGVPVDAEGLVVERLPADARVVCVTPSHQFPLGVAMSARRRAELLAWARAHGACIVEDDYDGEFRYGGRALDALQTLDGGDAVFYVGTFSKSLFPSLRLGYVVAPAWAAAALQAAKRIADLHADVAAQQTLADFIGEGHLARHVRKMRRLYDARRQALLAALARHGGARLQPVQAWAGLHVSALWAAGPVPKGLVERAAARGIGVETLERYAWAGAAQRGLAFSFALVEAGQIDAAVAALFRP